jgi:sulfur-carrier protein
MNVLTVRTFGLITEKTGQAVLKVEDVTDTAGLIQQLYDRYPVLQELKFAIAVNRKIIHTSTSLSSTDDIALLPPFSGG